MHLVPFLLAASAPALFGGVPKASDRTFSGTTALNAEGCTIETCDHAEVRDEWSARTLV